MNIVIASFSVLQQKNEKRVVDNDLSQYCFDITYISGTGKARYDSFECIKGFIVSTIVSVRVDSKGRLDTSLTLDQALTKGQP